MPQPAAAPSARPLVPAALSARQEVKPAARLMELDILRAFAILAVLVVHTTSQATVDITAGSRSQILYLVFNRISLFAVPAFIFLSGIVLFYRYKDRWSGREAIQFYCKRIQYIVLPYVLWALAYYLFIPWFFDTLAAHPLTAAEFVEKLLWGETAYHLYFIIIIVQFYAVFPILMSIVHRFPAAGRWLPLLGLAVQTAAYACRFYGGGLSHASSMAFTYAFVFGIGAWIGLNYDRFRQWLREFGWAATALAAFLGSAYTLFHLLLQFGVNFGLLTETLLFHGYGLTAAIGLMVVSLHTAERWTALAAVLISLGSVSFGIYFLHPMLLMIYSEYIQAPVASIAYHAVVMGSFLSVVLISWGMATLIKNRRGSWILLGR